jgi:hypothetical protein
MLMGQTSGENLSESVNFARVDQSWKTRKHDAVPCGRGRIERGDELLAGCVLLLNRCGESQKRLNLENMMLTWQCLLETYQIW